MRSPKCCGTTVTWFGPLQELPRGNPPRMRRGKKLFHHRGDDEYFWHWFDQTKKLAEGYGR